MDRKPETMFERLTQQTQVAEEVTFIQRFNYEVFFDPNTQVFTIAIVLPSGKRYQLPFERLNFGQFARDLNKALESVRNGMPETNGNGA